MRPNLPYISTTAQSMSTPASPRSPSVKMSQSQRTGSQDAGADGIRKRVCKACDRCRLKKSKCDGAHPCSRCKADNAICVFGERKKSHDKVYPKGYVEMLEQQQGQLVSGLQEMYRRLQSAHAWTGPSLNEVSGHPLTHDILAALNLLESKHDGSGEVEAFEDDCQKLQSKLIAEGAGFVQRRGSYSSDSEHSQRSQAQTATAHGTPVLSKPTPAPLFKENFAFSASASPSPLARSPVQRQRQSYPVATSSPLHASPLSNDPQLYQAEWTIPDMSNPAQVMRQKMAMAQEPDMSDMNANHMNQMFGQGQWDSIPGQFDGFASNTDNSMAHFANSMANLQGMHDFSMTADPMDVDFSKFIQVSS